MGRIREAALISLCVVGCSKPKPAVVSPEPATPLAVAKHAQVQAFVSNYIKKAAVEDEKGTALKDLFGETLVFEDLWKHAKKVHPKNTEENYESSGEMYKQMCFSLAPRRTL